MNSSVDVEPNIQQKTRSTGFLDRDRISMALRCGISEL